MNTIEKLKQILTEEFAQHREITSETTLEDLGLDSLEFVAFMQAIGRELGKIPEEPTYQIFRAGNTASIATRTEFSSLPI